MPLPTLGFWRWLTTLVGCRYVRINILNNWTDNWQVLRVVRREGRDCVVVPMTRYTTAMRDPFTGGYAVVRTWKEYWPLEDIDMHKYTSGRHTCGWEWLPGAWS